MARREGGVYVGGEKVLPAADPDELDEGLRLEIEYERTKEAVVEAARGMRVRYQEGKDYATTLSAELDAAIEAHDKAREAYRAHGGSVWNPEG